MWRVSAIGRLGPFRLVCAGVLAACVLKLWHILLLRQLLDSPLQLGAWLFAILVLVVIGFRPARTTVAACGLLLTLVFLFHWGYERAASDGWEYFVQVRSLVIDRDLDFRNDYATLPVRGTAEIYPFGAALLWTPFMVLAHGWLWLLNLFGGDHTLDGFGNPYQRAVGLGTLLYGFLGLVLVWRVLRDYFDPIIAALSTTFICFGSFLLWYLTVESSMVHGMSFFATTLFLFVWHRGRLQPTEPVDTPGWFRPRWWVMLGLTAGLMTMVRWQNITFIAAPLAISLFQCWRRRQPSVHAALLFAGGAVVAFLPQLVFWKLVRGSWFAVPASEHAFDLTSLHTADVLFSPNHGLLTSTPLLYLAVLGVPFFFGRDRALATVLAAGFVGQLIVNSGVDTWWGGSGFGARRFDNSLLLFAAGLGSVLVFCRKRPLVAPLALAGVLVAGNLSLMQDMRTVRVPSGEGITFLGMFERLYSRTGSPFSFPYNVYFAWAYDAPPVLYDRLRGRTYNNVAIDFGEDADDLFLGNGWHVAERNGAVTARWATGKGSSIVVPLKAASDYRLEIVCEPFAPPGAPTQTMDVIVNGHRVTQLVVTPGMRPYTVEIPAAVLRRDLNSFRFLYSYSMSPKETGTATDSRSLAVMFDTFRLTRKPGA